VPAVMEPHAGYLLIRFEGECTIGSVAEAKTVLLEGLAFAKDLRLDLDRMEEIDITFMQLIWAACREAGRTGASIAMRVPHAIEMSARQAGFNCFSNTSDEDCPWL
jgi:hypothetical protein